MTLSITKLKKFIINAGLFGIIALPALVASAKPVQHLPTVRFSNVGCGTCQADSGYFDVFYFNAEAAIGSRVFVHVGYEVGAYNAAARDYQPKWSWLHESRREMSQWEEFGWFVRIPRALYHSSRSAKTLGIDLYIVIQSPTGEIDYDGTDASNLGRAYLRGFIPDLSTCENLSREGQKSCAVPLEFVGGL